MSFFRRLPYGDDRVHYEDDPVYANDGHQPKTKPYFGGEPANVCVTVETSPNADDPFAVLLGPTYDGDSSVMAEALLTLNAVDARLLAAQLVEAADLAERLNGELKPWRKRRS